MDRSENDLPLASLQAVFLQAQSIVQAHGLETALPEQREKREQEALQMPPAGVTLKSQRVGKAVIVQIYVCRQKDLLEAWAKKRKDAAKGTVCTTRLFQNLDRDWCLSLRQAR